MLLERLDSQQSALVIIDVQNDLCAKNGIFSKTGEDLSGVDALVDNIINILYHWRKHQFPLIFIRSIIDENGLPQNIIERNLKAGRSGYLTTGKWGSEFYRIKPANNEKVISKYSYDPFLNTTLHQYLKEQQIRHIIVTGFFLDICIDSILRTGFQLGYYTSLVTDCSKGLFWDEKEILNFMIKFYDTELINSSLLINQLKSLNNEK